jgi:NAD(P)-dependent dehydrogenase (short-subunit alcohol dehydrogenase family)
MNNAQTIVITGASSGIGYAAVQACLAEGYRVIATARQHHDLDRLQAMGAQAVQLDLHSQHSVSEAAQSIRLLSGGSIAGLFNNAGYGLQVAMEDATWDALERQLTSNVIGPVMLTNQLLDCLQPGSKLVFNSSILGVIVVPFRGPYCMSKHAIEAAGDAYRLELESRGIAVHIIQPGPIEARFRANTYDAMQDCLQGKETRLDYARHIQRLQAEGPSKGTEPAVAVAAVFVDILQGRKARPRYLVTRMARLASRIKRVVGDGFDYFARRSEPVSERVESSPRAKS